jgi:hypothetical protein
MPAILDAILKKDILIGPETVNAEFFSPSIDIDNREDEFGVLFSYENGASVNMTLWLQVSPDNITWFDVADSDQLITDPSGNHFWDVAGTGASFLRVRVEVASGSIDISKIFYSAKRRH